jgi:RNA polymerase sigma-70 factor (ECF subfamily)
MDRGTELTMPPSLHRRSAPSLPPTERRVFELPIPDSDQALVTALKAGRSEGKRALFDRYSDDVERVLCRILGPDQEIVDLLQDVFVVALSSIDKLKNPDALRSWLTGIAVRKARKCILRRRRWSIVRLLSPSDLPEREAITSPAEVSEALRATYAVLAELPADERIVFALRHVDGMELVAVAGACGISLATVKRRLSRAQRTFCERAQQHAALVEWLGRGDPWS